MARIGGGSLSRLLGTRGIELSNAEISLRGRRQEIVLGIKVSVEVRIENIGGLAMGSNNKSGKVVGNGRVVGRGVHGIDRSHGGKEVSVNAACINSAQSLCDSIT